MQTPVTLLLDQSSYMVYRTLPYGFKSSAYLSFFENYIVDSYVLIFTMHDSLISELETSCYEVRKAELVLYIVYPFFKRLTP